MSRFINAVHRAWLQWCINDLAMYLRACEKDGLVDSLNLRIFRGQLADMECKLISLQQPMAGQRVGARA